VLYFSSSGRQGLGGLDVFAMDLNEKNATSINVGKPVNSEKDDFAFSYNSTKDAGFFSSNRSGNDDIYMANAICAVTANTIVTDTKTGKVLAGASVSILDYKKNTIKTTQTDADGLVTYALECNKAYSIQATKEGYESGSFPIAATKGGKVAVAAALNPIEVIIKPTEIVLKPINFEFDKSNITKEGAFELDQLVMVLKNNPEMIIMVKSHTDNQGSDEYNMRLSDRRAKSTVQYVLSKGIVENRISGKGYGETEPKADCKENCTEEDHATNRRSEFLIVK
jgi:outer membrane protein OmpA-like peptidoglycan-associated protein